VRILIFSQYFWPESFRVNDVVAALTERGHKVTVLTSTPNYPDGQVFADYAANPSAFIHYYGADIFRIPQIARGKSKLRLIANYLSFVVSGFLFAPWHLRERSFDAIFMFETSPITSALPALFLRRLKRAPLLMWVLDLWPDTLSAVGVVKSPKILKLLGQLVSFIYRKCDLILMQSKGFKENIRQYAGGDERVRYFPQWAEAGLIEQMLCVEPAPEMWEQRRAFNILFAGNIGEAQDFPAILAAAEILRDETNLRWFIVGDGRASDSVRAEISRRGLNDQVVMLGRFPLERMPSFFRCADALLVSLRDEPIFALTIPGKVQSYLATGVPMVAMLNGEGRRVIEDAGSGLTCAAGDSAELAATVRTLMSLTESERAQMGNKGRAYCAAEFDRDWLIGRLEGWMAEAKLAFGKDGLKETVQEK
jgi:colanic acid biosynthesis glycosyl transferase WcaI